VIELENLDSKVSILIIKSYYFNQNKILKEDTDKMAQLLSKTLLDIPMSTVQIEDIQPEI
jgi:hypothetical protein